MEQAGVPSRHNFSVEKEKTACTQATFRDTRTLPAFKWQILLQKNANSLLLDSHPIDVQKSVNYPSLRFSIFNLSSWCCSHRTKFGIIVVVSRLFTPHCIPEAKTEQKPQTTAKTEKTKNDTNATKRNSFNVTAPNYTSKEAQSSRAVDIVQRNRWICWVTQENFFAPIIDILTFDLTWLELIWILESHHACPYWLQKIAWTTASDSSSKFFNDVISDDQLCSTKPAYEQQMLQWRQSLTSSSWLVLDVLKTAKAVSVLRRVAWRRLLI